MSEKQKNQDSHGMSEVAAYEHILRSFASASGMLIEAIREIDDLQLDAHRNRRELNTLLNWMFQAQEEIHQNVPELNPPRLLRKKRWEADLGSEYTRKTALWQLWHHLRLAALILKESGPFAQQIHVHDPGLDAQVNVLEEIRKVVFQEIWQEMSDRDRRGWIREHELAAGLIEPPPVDRRSALERLSEKLETASKVLDESAGLIAELDVGSERIRAIGYCLVAIFDIQEQIYKERPDLIPESLKEAYELPDKENGQETE
jgi:hypothetical protein